jgi:S-adenosylmethionine synthetase
MAAAGGLRPAEVADQKIKNPIATPTLRLVTNPDISAEIGAGKGSGQVLVAFAAETRNAVEHARAKLVRKKADLIVVNEVGVDKVFGRETNAVTILAAQGPVIEMAEAPMTRWRTPSGTPSRHGCAEHADGRTARSATLQAECGGPGPRERVARIDSRRPQCSGRRSAAAGDPAVWNRRRRISPKPRSNVARRLFTSESVTEGHPDKIADQISDAVLDAMLAADPASRVAVETMITTGQVHVAGEVTTQAYVDINTIVRETILGIGYDSSKKGFDGASCGVNVAIGAQSPDIAQGVDSAIEQRSGEAGDQLDAQGAGDQGMMFGFACYETPELMPLPIALAHRLARRLTAVRKDGTIPYLRPDGKTQVTIEYDGLRPVRLNTVVVSSQHAPDISLESLLSPDVREHVIGPEIEGLGLDVDGYRLLVNPTGRFEVGGPMGDAGLTGRKIIVDTYGGYARHGGALRDPSRWDWSAVRDAVVPRTWSPPGWPSGARCRSRTRSARRTRSACSWRPSAPRTCRWTGSRRPSPRCSTCVRPRSSVTWTCCGRSTSRRPPTATSAASCPT